MISARVLGGAHSGGGLDWKDFSSNYEADRDLVVVLICIQLPDWSLFPPPIVWRISSHRHRFPLCYSRFPRVPFFFAEMLAVSHLLLINTIIASLSHPVLGSSLLGLDQQQRQTLRDRLFQTNLRGPRWSTQFILWYMRKIEGDIPAGNDNQNVLLDLVTGSMDLAGLKTETLDYTLNRSVSSNFHIIFFIWLRICRFRVYSARWDPRWWSLNLQLTNGTNISVPTTGFWPYSGDSGLAGVTAPIHDAGTYGLSAIERANTSTLDLENLPEGGSIIFFDNPSPTRNYSLPGYHVLGWVYAPFIIETD